MLRNFVRCLLALLLVGHIANAALMLDSTPSSVYETLSDQYQGSVFWVQVTNPDGTQSFRGSGVRLNEWYGLTAAHLFDLNGVQYTNPVIGTGSNYLTDPGTTRNVTSVTIAPGWDSTFNSTDLAIVKFDQPLPGPDLTIGTLDIDDVVTGAGFGTPGTPSTGVMPLDGKRRAWQAPVAFFGAVGVGDMYAALDFASFTNLPDNGKALPGDSGSPDFNSEGQLVGINDGGSSGTASTGETLALRVGLYQSWIDANTAVPEPTAFAAICGWLVLVLTYRRHRLRRV